MMGISHIKIRSSRKPQVAKVEQKPGLYPTYLPRPELHRVEPHFLFNCSVSGSQYYPDLDFIALYSRPQRNHMKHHGIKL